MPKAGFSRDQPLTWNAMCRMFIRECPSGQHLQKGDRGSKIGTRGQAAMGAWKQPESTLRGCLSTKRPHPSFSALDWKGWTSILLPDPVTGWGLPQDGHDLGQGSCAAGAIPSGLGAKGCWLIALPAAESISPSFWVTLCGSSLWPPQVAKYFKRDENLGLVWIIRFVSKNVLGVQMWGFQPGQSVQVELPELPGDSRRWRSLHRALGRILWTSKLS